MTGARPDSRLGTDLGPYHVERLLGRGGMGVVYLAEQRELGRKVALKLLAPEYAQDEAFRARFLRESRAAASIDHANIIPIYEAGEADGTYFLAMRYVEGTDLDERLKSGALDPGLTVALLAQVAGGLDAAHAAGLVHRDVKPANLLLADEGGDVPHVYLTDFGLTKRRASQSGLTRAGSTLGTLEYMAPEQVEGRAVDAPADEYALACVAFQCLTGSVPFVRDSDVAVAMAHLRDAPPSAVAMRPELPTGVDTVLTRGMAKDPVDRYESCAAFVADLQQALGGDRVGAPSRSGQVPDRRRGQLALAAVVGVALVVFAGLALALGIGGQGQANGSPSTPTGTPGEAAAGGSSPGNSLIDPAAFPTEVEAALLGKIPVDLRSSCVRGSQAALHGPSGTTTTPLANVTCSSGSFAFTAIQLASDGVTADDVLREAAAARDVPDGDCLSTTPAIGPWRQGSRDVGSVACYLDGVDAAVDWTYDDDALLARARAQYGDVKGMVSWWIDTRDLIGSDQAGVAAPFPSTAEAALLDRIPEALRQDCGRGSYGLIANSLPVQPIASIQCPLAPDSGAALLDVRQISGFGDLTASQIVAAVVGRIGGCPRPARPDGRWSIGDQEMGSIVCYSDQNPAAVIDWSYDDDDILARVRRRDEKFDVLLAWWQANAPTIGQ